MTDNFLAASGRILLIFPSAAATSIVGIYPAVISKTRLNVLPSDVMCISDVKFHLLPAVSLMLSHPHFPVHERDILPAIIPSCEQAQVVVLLEIIAKAMTMNDKVLIFSQRPIVLDFLERLFMTKGWGGSVKTPPPPIPAWRQAVMGNGAREATTWGPWKNETHYFRLDGSTSAKMR